MNKWDKHRPCNLFGGSLASPSLVAAIINGKYVNVEPLYRLEKEFEKYELAHYQAEYGKLGALSERRISEE